MKKDEVALLQSEVDKIRNIAIIGHIDHGKTTLSDSLLSSNGIISLKSAGKIRYLDSRLDEQERGGKEADYRDHDGDAIEDPGDAATDAGSSGVGESRKTNYLINLIDSPGHVDFSSEVGTASRLCDGGLLLVDAVEGVSSQTHTVLRQAIIEKVKPILVLNKIDRLITEWKLNPDEAFLHLSKIIEQVNVILGNFEAEDILKKELQFQTERELGVTPVMNETADRDNDEYYFSPEKGNVIFASAIDGWAFRTSQFANLYATKLGLSREVLNSYMWGSYYFNPKTRTVEKEGKGRMRPLFVQLALENIWAVYDAAFGEDIARVEKIIKSLALTIHPRELKNKDKKGLLRSMMTQWLPLTLAVLTAVVEKIPSPRQAQKYKLNEILKKQEYTQDLGNKAEVVEERRKTVDAITACDSGDGAPMVAFLSKVFPVPSTALPVAIQEARGLREGREVAVQRSKARAAARAEGDAGVSIEAQAATYDSQQPKVDDSEVFIGFARIYSGCIKIGQTINILGPKHDPGREDNHLHCHEMKVERLFLIMGRELLDLDVVPAGNVFGILCSVDVGKTATLSSLISCPSLAGIKLEAPPILRVALEPTDPMHLPELIKGLRLLDRADPVVQVEFEETGENVIVCAGEIHLERCLNDLRTRFSKIGIEASEPLVPYRETITPFASVLAAKMAIDQLGIVEKINGMISLRLRVIPLPSRVTDYLLQMEEGLANTTVLEGMRECLELAGIEGERADIAIDWETLLTSIVTLGPKEFGANLLINRIPDVGMSVWDNCTKGSYEHEASIIAGFRLCTLQGPLCAEPMAGVAVIIEKFEVMEGDYDVAFLSGHILSVFKEAIKQGFTDWSPRLMLAMYTCELQTEAQYLGKVDGVLSRRRGKILSEDITEGSTMFTLNASLPVVESFGFVDELRKKTSGLASPQFVFSGFEILDIDPYWVPTTIEELEDLGAIAERENLALHYMEKVRLRKGLAVERKLVEHGEKQRNLKNK